MTSDRLFGAEDYDTKWDAVAYLEEFYSANTPLQKWVMKNLKQIFDHVDVPKVGAQLLDVGTGPVLSYLVSAAKRFDTIYVSDISQKNINHLQNFVKGVDTGFDWEPIFEHAAELHGETDPKKLKQELRQAIKGEFRCDVLKEEALSPNKIDPVDVLMSSLCIEAAVRDPEEYTMSLKRLTKHYLKPAGMLILVVACDETYYTFGKKRYYCCKISRDEIIQSIHACGFQALTLRNFGFDADAAADGTASKPEEQSDAAGFVLVTAVRNT